MTDYNLPERIWLQKPALLLTGEKVYIEDDITWGVDQIDDTDVEYVRADKAQQLKEDKRHAEDVLANCGIGGIYADFDGWEDGIPRVATGIPDRVDRLRCLGNAVVPQIAEWIGRRIVEVGGNDERAIEGSELQGGLPDSL